MCATSKGTWNNSTLFANLFWDFHNDSAFTPYIGAGLGLAFNYTGYDFTTNNGDKFSVDDRFTNFAWNVGVGASYSFNENLALTLPTALWGWVITKSRPIRVPAANMRSAAIPTTTNSCWACASRSKPG